jgi:hypothetical protein
MSAELRLFPTESAAKKAGLQLASPEGGRLHVTLYALLPAGQKKPCYLLSTTQRPAVAELRWASDQGASLTKVGRFLSGGSFLPLQTSMRRTRSSEA